MIRHAKHGTLNLVHCQEAGRQRASSNVLDGTLLVSVVFMAMVSMVWLSHAQQIWMIADAFLFYYGTSRNVLGMIDVRSASSVYPERNEFQSLPISPDVQLTNDAMVNTLYVSRDGIHVITGDSRGAVRVWDVRARK